MVFGYDIDGSERCREQTCEVPGTHDFAIFNFTDFVVLPYPEVSLAIEKGGKYVFQSFSVDRQRMEDRPIAWDKVYTRTIIAYPDITILVLYDSPGVV